MFDQLYGKRPNVKAVALGEGAGVAMHAAAFAKKYVTPEPNPLDPLFQQMADARKPKYSQEEISMAYAILMTGPKATPPRFKTVRRIIKQMRANMDIKGKRVVRFDEATGKTLTYHPTKGLRHVA